MLTATDAVAGVYDVSYSTNGDFTFSCTATDSDGLQDTEQTTVQVFYRRYITIFNR